MDREQIVALGNKSLINNSLTSIEVSEFLKEYCHDKSIEMSKNWEDVEKAVDMSILLVISRGIWKGYFDKALDYYCAKFGVISMLKEVCANTPFGVEKHFQVLKYY